MRNIRRPWRFVSPVALAVLGVASACGGGGASGSFAGSPISASLSTSTIVVPRDGTPTYVQIHIQSTSETALVSFVGLPAGVQVSYQASDTNPSGLLTFMAAGKVMAGTSMPVVTVQSAGQTTMVNFTLVVPAP